MKKKNWELATEHFLNRYINKPWFEGAVLCGSYSTGNNDDFSDIDVTIVASDDIKWQEKSNCYVDGFLMEWIINPVSKYEEYMKREDHIIKNMFAYGRVLIDKNGVVKKLHNKALVALKRKIKPLSAYENARIKYGLWCKYDELKSQVVAGLHTDYQYWMLLDSLIGSYYKFKCLPEPPTSKIERLYTDCEFRKRYHIAKMPEKRFIDLVLNVINASSKQNKMDAIDKLYKYVIRVGGGFDIGNWNGKRKL